MSETDIDKEIEKLKIDIEKKIRKLNELENRKLEQELTQLGFDIPPLEKQLDKIFSAIAKTKPSEK